MRTTARLILLAAVSLLVLSALPSCGGDDGASPATSDGGDAQALLEEAQAAMRDLDSFQLQMITTVEETEITYTIGWQRPDTFYVMSHDVQTQIEDDETKTIDKGLFETTVVGDKIYSRYCRPAGGGCEPWEEGPRETIYFPLSAPGLEPMWTIELPGLMSDTQIIGEEDFEGVTCTRIQGRANLFRAMIQSAQRAEEERGPIFWGEQCEAVIGPSGGQEDECHDTTLEEYTALYEDLLREQDENPPLVEVWLGRDDKLMRRLGFRQATADEDTIEFPYTLSHFNEVNIKAPD
ncbi:MAG: hypothetical protein AMJ77_01005 [Dehalococcoidia bacterium SM23_28_2]|nr:MAG: hypothetical protein AMJ77_01005 [Dehalococcoidia bacterium SM23_28_2]